MIPGQTEHVGNGAYLYFDGHGFELRANHHETPTDRVYIDSSCVMTLLRLINETIEHRSNERAHIQHEIKMTDDPHYRDQFRKEQRQKDIDENGIDE